MANNETLVYAQVRPITTSKRQNPNMIDDDMVQYSEISHGVKPALGICIDC